MNATTTRVGLVLGAGGVLGAAWMTGALAALQEKVSIPLGDVDLIIGTSAGSVLTAALRCGIGVDDIVAQQRGVPPAYLRDHVDLDGGGAMPPRPRMRIGSPRLALTAALSPHRVYPWVAASAWLPQGRGTHDAVHAMVSAMVDYAGDPKNASRADRDGQTWVMAMDYGTGARVAFGRDDAPPASLPDSVVASCSIPGWYRPAVIGGRQYVDGGIRSTTSLDLVSTARLDEVYILAPLASFQLDNPHGAFERLERRFRRLVTLGLRREARKIRAAGTRVMILTPGPEDLVAMGANLMDPARRSSVLETSLRTSPTILEALDDRPDEAA